MKHAESPKTQSTLNMEALKIDLNSEQEFGVDKVILHVPIRKPYKYEFFRTHSAPEYSAPFAILEDKEERDFFILSPEMCRLLPNDYFPAQVCAVINRQNDIFLWPVKLPKPNGRIVVWHTSAQQAVEQAKLSWLKMVANQSLGAYEVFKPVGDIPEPVWPVMTFEQMFQLAFKDKYISSAEHPVVKRLLGAL